ncbi:hypothetical protein GcC1_188058 [Golovinomyces cichoracearum]|uniref:Uncharacterized protein n=1 Tax=Golovinomyces cichoracearum TaxID=62708 RepID=A0A420HJM4_9PEZI|nr:hypothetical protein GcC1_188058 [Golovinomyces cichoracearum]
MSTATRSYYYMTAYYASLEEATEGEKAFALRNGYCLKIRRTKTVGNRTGGLIKGRILECVHSGKTSSVAQIRNTSTLHHDCPLQAQICKEKESNSVPYNRLRTSTTTERFNFICDKNYKPTPDSTSIFCFIA